jgi:NAD(P)-dependent dehydrogenase (short-subunit alcohol dehydrogenase family)
VTKVEDVDARVKPGHDELTLSSRSVLVTGASEGIGRGIALAVGRQGARVMVTALDQAAAESVAAEIRARGDVASAAVCNVTVATDVEGAVATAIAQFGALDAIVHNANSAYGSRPIPIEAVSDLDWDDQVAVALRAVRNLAAAGFAELKRRQGALVILTSSSGVEATPGIPVYSAVKAAQRALTKSLAREWGPHGVRVNALAPSAVTPAVGRYLEAQPDMRDWMLARASLRRLGDAESDIGGAVAFLIGPDSAFVTGQTLFVSGGSLMV